MQKALDRVPHWVRSACLILAGILMYSFSDAINTAAGYTDLTKAPNYHAIGALAILAGIVYYLKRRKIV